MSIRCRLAVITTRNSFSFHSLAKLLDPPTPTYMYLIPCADFSQKRVTPSQGKRKTTIKNQADLLNSFWDMLLSNRNTHAQTHILTQECHSKTRGLNMQEMFGFGEYFSVQLTELSDDWQNMAKRHTGNEMKDYIKVPQNWIWITPPNARTFYVELTLSTLQYLSPRKIIKPSGGDWKMESSPCTRWARTEQVASQWSFCVINVFQVIPQPSNLSKAVTAPWDTITSGQYPCLISSKPSLISSGCSSDAVCRKHKEKIRVMNMYVH